MRSGFIHIVVGAFRNGGTGGEAWSSYGTTQDANGSDILSAYYLYLNNARVYLSHGPYPRAFARPLRCLSTVLGMGRVGKLVITQH